LASFFGNDGGCLVWSHTVEVGVHHTVRFTLTTLACESNMEETSVQEQVPDQRTTPIVGSCLREHFDSDIIVSTLKESWRGPAFLQVQANKVLS